MRFKKVTVHHSGKMCSWEDVSSSLKHPVTMCPRSYRVHDHNVSTVGKQREKTAGPGLLSLFYSIQDHSA